MRHNHGDWHIALQNIQDNEAEQIRKDNDVAFSSWYDSINANAEQDYYIGGKMLLFMVSKKHTQPIL